MISNRLERDKLKVGQEVEVIGYNKTTRGKILEEANAGDQTGLLARGLNQSDVKQSC